MRQYRAAATDELQRFRRRAAIWTRSAVDIALAPGLIIVLLLGSASTCAVVGTRMLAGDAWALIAAAAIGFVLAGLLLRGMSRG